MPSTLSIFADESGEWGKRSEYYLITLVFHDQSSDITPALNRYQQSLIDCRLPDIPFHAGPLLTGHDDYDNMDMADRKKLLSPFVILTRHLPITYRTFIHRKSDFDNDRRRFENELSRTHPTQTHGVGGPLSREKPSLTAAQRQVFSGNGTISRETVAHNGSASGSLENRARFERT